MSTRIPEETATSIFRVYDLNVVAAGSPETSVLIYHAIRRNIRRQ